MKVFRAISIIFAIAYIVLLIVCLNVEITFGIRLAVVIVGIITTVLNMISTFMWGITDTANQYNSQESRWSRMSHR